MVVVKVNARYPHPLTHAYCVKSIIIDEFGGYGELHFQQVFQFARRIHKASNEYAEIRAPAEPGCFLYD